MYAKIDVTIKGGEGIILSATLYTDPLRPETARQLDKIPLTMERARELGTQLLALSRADMK